MLTQQGWAVIDTKMDALYYLGASFFFYYNYLNSKSERARSLFRLK